MVPPELSVVAPMFNEETNVEVFVAAIHEALRDGPSYELIIVDDGSSDGTWRRLSHLAEDDGRLRAVHLSRNFGHQGALLCGLEHARGRAVVSLDGDLQHPPSVIVDLVERWREGFQVVNTRRIDSADTTAFKRLTSRWFYALFSRLTGVQMDAGASDFRLLDRAALDALLAMRDNDLFIRGLVSWIGFSTTTVPYQAAERFSGTSKFNLRRMVRFALGALLSFSLLPLRLGIWVGFATSGLAVLELAYIMVQYLSGNTIPGWASVMTFMALMFGILFVLLGIIGTYLGKIYELLKHRPRFIVGERVGFPEGS